MSDEGNIVDDKYFELNHPLLNNNPYAKLITTYSNYGTLRYYIIGVVYREDKIAVKDFFRSLSPNKKTDTKQINLETKQSDIVTIIILESPQYKNQVGNVTIQGNTLTYSQKGVSKKVRL